MPYCTSCGTEVQPADVFCGKCGTRQPASTPPPGASSGFGASMNAGGSALNQINPRTASLLCYLPVVGWIPSIIVLAADRFRTNRTVRFHAFQGLYLFVAWMLIEWVLSPLFFTLDAPLRRLIVGLAKAGIFAGWIWMLVQVAQDRMYKLPIIGELADRSLSEQPF
jgi:uncharacterized membrane protein